MRAEGCPFERVSPSFITTPMLPQPDPGNAPTAEGILAIIARCGLSLSPDQARQLAVYLRMLMHWNSRMNLVGPKDWTTVCSALVTDSIHLAAIIPELGLPGEPLTLDIGAGAGLPGIPLRVCWSRGEYIMLEPRQKRAIFLNTLLAQLKLPGTSVQRLNAETYGLSGPPADLILSRGVRPWAEFLDLTSPLLKKGGKVIVFSNQGYDTTRAIPPGWSAPEERAYCTAGGQTRYFWLFSPNISPS